jgi:negative regulator of sigma E activity
MRQKSKIRDRDLMALFDGELEGEELARVERALAEDEQARGKLVAMRLTGELLREAVERDTRADDIADSVMAKLDAEPDVPLLEEPKLDQKAAPHTSEPANDNARTLWTLAAAAAAVAAGLFVWGNMAPNDVSSVAVAPKDDVVAVPSPPSQDIEALQPERPARPSIGTSVAKVDDEDAVEIAQLDFGTHTGSVFKVRDENTGASTAVVWVTDSGDDE